MPELIWRDSFKRQYRKWVRKHPDHRSLFLQTISLLSREPFHPSLRTHALTGKMEGMWAVRITQEYRLVFIFCSRNNDQILLLGIGTHKEVY
jgi:addiction module RelE/StbE family toxin